MKNDKRDCTSGRKSVVKLQGLPLILVNWIHHLADHLLGPILHLHRTLSMGMISLLVALQSSAIECNAERFQLRQIKQAHCLDIDKCRKLLHTEGCKALRSVCSFDTSLDLLRAL